LPIEFDIARRLSFSSEQRSFTRWVAILSATGMAIGVASLIVVMSVMNGLAGELTGRLLSAVPHITILSTGSLSESKALSGKVEKDWPSAVASPFLTSQAMLRSPFYSAGAELTGYISLPSDTASLQIIEGDLSSLFMSRYQVALGQSLAQQLGVSVTDQVDVVLPQLSVTPLGLVPRYRRLTVSAIISVGASPDSTLAWTSYETMQKLARAAQPDGVQIRLADPSSAGWLAEALQKQSSAQSKVTTWADTNRSLFSAIRMEKILVSVLLSALVGVAAFSVVSSLSMSVSEKRSDIAALRVLGLTPARVMLSFLLHGLLLAILGVFVGTILGLLIAMNLEVIMNMIASVSGWTLFDPEVYYIGGLPSKILATDVFSIVFGAVSLSLFAATYPAIRASRIAPVTALEGLRI